LTHAGVNETDVTFVRVELDREDSRIIYEIEFYTADYREFDYDICVTTGEILDIDYDADYYTPPQGVEPNDGSEITRERAIAIAIDKIPGATADHVRELERDRDDGRVKYEGTIIYQEWEYEFEIDAFSGAILEWDAEPLDND